MKGYGYKLSDEDGVGVEAVVHHLAHTHPPQLVFLLALCYLPACTYLVISFHMNSFCDNQSFVCIVWAAVTSSARQRSHPPNIVKQFFSLRLFPRLFLFLIPFSISYKSVPFSLSTYATLTGTMAVHRTTLILDQLPPEIYPEIGSNLTGKELDGVTRASKRLRALFLPSLFHTIRFDHLQPGVRDSLRRFINGRTPEEMTEIWTAVR